MFLRYASDQFYIEILTFAYLFTENNKRKPPEKNFKKNNKEFISPKKYAKQTNLTIHALDTKTPF